MLRTPWGGKLSDEKGNKVIEFISRNNLYLVNDNRSPPLSSRITGKAGLI